jgi:hypothetical protein
MPISSPLCPVITRLHRAHPRQASGDHQRHSQLMGVLIVLIIRSGTGNPPEVPGQPPCQENIFFLHLTEFPGPDSTEATA